VRTAFILAVATLALLHASPAQAVTDATPPVFSTQVIAGPPSQIKITVQDTGSGLASIKTTSMNAIVTVPTFTTGTTSPVVVVATKANQTSRTPFTISVLVKDVAGNSALYDPLVADLVIPPNQRWVSQSYSGIPSDESRITLQNGHPGVWAVLIAVNGHWSGWFLLDSEQSLAIDGSPWMREEGANTISVLAFGLPGSSVTVAIMPPD
jgi:hypothetical protein